MADPSRQLKSLARLGFSDGRSAAEAWAQVGSDDERLLHDIARAADPDHALADLARLMEALGSESSGSPGRRADDLRAALSDNDDLRARLVAVLGGSRALADHLLRHPTDVEDLRHPVPPADDGPWALDHMACVDDRDGLRRTYRRLVMRIAADDLTGRLGVGDVTDHLSDLATAALEVALRIARTEVEDATDARLAIIAMGKCGARELNYVSDVDVIFVAEPAEGADEQRAIRVATQLAATTMRICSDHTPEGTLWPVDANLRPEGKQGPLVRTLASHEAYYHRWAKAWEFQALLKARPVAGDAEVGRDFVEMTDPQVWEVASKPDFVAGVRAMRRRVVDNIPHDQVDRQVKLAPGGLRDIEFAVQLLQLVHGRTDPGVRDPATLTAIDQLIAGGYVGREDGMGLVDAYQFLRRVEHRLQLVQLRRTHLMPSDDESLRVLARSMDYRTDPVTTFTSERTSHAREVRRLHEKLFYRPLLDSVAAIPGAEARLTPEAATERLAALGFHDPASGLRAIEALTSGVTRQAAIQKALLPAMLGWFADAPDPDAGLVGFRRLSETLGRTPWYLRQLRDEGAAAERLAKLLATSRYATDLLMRAPQATQMLTSSSQLQPADPVALALEAVKLAERHEEASKAIDAVRAVRRRELLRTAAGDVFGSLDLAQSGQALSAIARATIEGALVVAWSDVAAERGPIDAEIAIIAMGRLGSHEMSYGSDADVLFVYEPHSGVAESDVQPAVQAVATRLRTLLSAPGADPGFDVDAGLRPEGRKGPLVRSLTSYARYYEKWGEIWEAQALLRAEPVGGDRDLAERFIELINPLRYPDGGLSDAEVGEVRRIKARVDNERLPRGANRHHHLKLGPGGIADVEWTVQLLQLRHAHELSALQTTSTLAALEALADAGLATQAQASRLRSAWTRASQLRNAIMLVRARPSDQLPTAPVERVGAALLCGMEADDTEALVDDYLRRARRAAQAAEELFWE